MASRTESGPDWGYPIAEGLAGHQLMTMNKRPSHSPTVRTNTHRG